MPKTLSDDDGMDSALESPSPIINVDEEWEKFCQKHQPSGRSNHKCCSGSSIPSYYFLAQAGSIHRRNFFVLISGIAFAAIHTYIKRSQEPTQVTADTHPEVINSDSAKQVAAKDSLTHPKPEKPAIHKTFENVAFEQMISEIASYYDLQSETLRITRTRPSASITNGTVIRASRTS